uniref:Dolichyl-diphosphooligosaccharide--protein glycosyltransferase 48 kDa subunit n=1 Tax=Globodera pallida TaxID=36090 RepID=A0A183CF94_GLOPA
MKFPLFLIALCLLASNLAADRILMLIDNPATRDSHSIFIKSLKERAHSVIIAMADDPNLSLIKFGEFLYDHLIIFAPSVDEFGGNINVAEIAKFIDGGGNVVVAADTNLGDAIRDLAAEVGFEFGEDQSMVIDHHTYDTVLDDGSHTTIAVPNEQLIKSALITGDNAQQLSPVLYRGIALVVDELNPLQLILMTASSTAYSYSPNTAVDEYPSAVGRSTILLGALQARNNARVVLSGSLDFFSNKFFDATLNSVGHAANATKSGNQELAASILEWVLKESGVLRLNSVKHHIVGQKFPPAEYTIMENVRYEINIEELKNGKWIPFQGKDVQMEFVRIDPFVRITLKNNNGKLTAEFKIPDVYGVYKFLVDYHRIGYTHLNDVQQVSVRPLQHTQYERFSRCAYPYYVSAFSMMIGVVLFSFVFLYYKETPLPSSTPAPPGKSAQKPKAS